MEEDLPYFRYEVKPTTSEEKFSLKCMNPFKVPILLQFSLNPR